MSIGLCSFDWESQTLGCYLLGSDGRYTVSAVSRAIPGLVVADLAPFLLLRGQMDENAVVRQFRAWVRQQFAVGGPCGQRVP